MYEHTLKVHGQYLAHDQALPQNDTADGNGAVLDLTGTMGGVEIVARVSGEITLADTKTLTIGLQESADGESWNSLATLFGLTSDGGDAIAEGTVLGRFVLPTDAEPHVKAVLATDDGSVSGSVSVYPHYLAR